MKTSEKYTSEYFAGFKNQTEVKRVLNEFAKRVMAARNFVYESPNNECFVLDFYKRIISSITGIAEIDISIPKSYTNAEIVLEDGYKINLNHIKTLGNKSGSVSQKHFPYIAAAYNNLYSTEIGYKISKDWKCIPINNFNAKVPGELNMDDNEKKRIDALGYVGKWQGIHFYSRDEKYFLRRIVLEIEATETVHLHYVNTRGLPEKITGTVIVGEGGDQMAIEILYKLPGNSLGYTIRVLYCLARKLNDSNCLQGTYAGFSPTSRKPYGGAVSFKKLPNRTKIRPENIEVIKQVYNDWTNEGINNLKEAYETHLELPSRSLSKVLLAKFRNYRLNTKLDGVYMTIGIGSGNADTKKMDCLVSYPMLFSEGLCTTHWTQGVIMTSPVRSIGVLGRHVWLHMRPDDNSSTTVTNISFFVGDDDVSHDEYKGISYRINKHHQLQARTEVLIKLDELVLGEKKVKKYKYNDVAYNELKKKYYGSHPYFRELIDAFESIVSENRMNSHILQNKILR